MGRVERLQRDDGNTIAYAMTQAAKEGGLTPTVVFLGGFRSDMTGTKAVALEAWARKTGQDHPERPQQRPGTAHRGT